MYHQPAMGLTPDELAAKINSLILKALSISLARIIFKLPQWLLVPRQILTSLTSAILFSTWTSYISVIEICNPNNQRGES